MDFAVQMLRHGDYVWIAVSDRSSQLWIPWLMRLLTDRSLN
jgi:hypothetical protein